MEKWRASNKCIICNIHFYMLHAIREITLGGQITQVDLEVSPLFFF